MEVIKRSRGRPRKIINIEPEPDTIEEHWEKKSKSRDAIKIWDENSVSSIPEEEDENFLNELDNEHYNDEPFQKADDIFKDIKVKKTKKEKVIKSHFEDDNSLFSEKKRKSLSLFFF